MFVVPRFVMIESITLLPKAVSIRRPMILASERIAPSAVREQILAKSLVVATSIFPEPTKFFAGVPTT
jgi:hypothetical protein